MHLASLLMLWGYYYRYMDPVTFGYHMIGIFIFAVVVAAAIVIYVIFWLIRNKLSSIKRVEAKVILKRNRGGNVVITGSNYVVVFDVNGCKYEFAVSEADYIKCDEGTEGLLVFRGEEFKYFIPNVR
ncbi:MAG: DUF2500 family protein [Armatimonadota bacterium]